MPHFTLHITPEGAVISLQIGLSAPRIAALQKANVKSWSATRKDPATYDQWAAAQVRTEIARAGYRLAAILKKIWP